MQRMTKQRRAIMELLQTNDSFLSAQHIFSTLQTQGHNIGLATVYRNLQAMVNANLIDVVRPENSDVQLFHYCEKTSHHHHLVCQCCGKTTNIVGDTVEKWAQKIAQENNFTLLSHAIELYGLCNSCINCKLDASKKEPPHPTKK